jgi:DNA primase
MIPKDLEQAIKDAAVIRDIVAERVALTRAGVNWKGKCPFHNEDTPSFVVFPAKGNYKCFGCGAHGDAIGFVKESERISYPEALKSVGKKYNIDVPDRELTPEELAAYKRRENALDALVKQNHTFRDGLAKNEKALAWLTDERKIAPETIQKWGIGYAGTGFFGGRITYPIQNLKGEIVGFTGRRLNEELEGKFKNSVDSELYKKSELLYGLNFARLKIHSAKKCYIVEGQHDVLMMHQHGFENTVAPSGTALTTQQIALIKPWTKNIVLLLDGDSAGIKASIKHITSLLNEQVNLRIVILPEEEDPDSFLRGGEGTTARGHDYTTARAYIENSEIDFIEFKAGVFKKEIETDPSREGELITEITNDISLVHDKNTRAVYTRRCAGIFGVKEGELNRDIARLREKIKANPEDGKWFAFEFEETKKAIEDAREVNILANFEEVIDYQLNENHNYIGMNCTPLQKGEILKLKKITKTVIFNEIIKELYDPKEQEESPTVINLKRLISFGIDVRMRREWEIMRKRKKVNEEDEDEYDAITEVSFINFPDWYITSITRLLSPANDLFTGWAIEHIAELLSYLPESSRMVKIGNVQSEFKTANVKLIVGDFKKILDKYLKKNAKSFEPITDPVDMADNPMNLTSEQLNDLNRYQHYIDRNQIFHVSKTGHIARISNFTIKPIIHSNTSNGHFKLFEMINEDGLKANISLDTKDMNDVRRFKCAVEEKGFFVFKGEQFQLDNIKERLYKHTTYSNEIEQLGWQSEGFWAWGDGVTTLDGKFIKTDDNGLISVGDKNYLIKPFSNLYSQDKTAYINEKKFVHLTSETTFKDWNSRYLDVFGDNAMILTCALATVFYSDAIFKLVHGELPLINLFGPKGTGKTQQADSLLAFFGEKQPVNNLSKVTIYGLSQTLKSFHNAFCLIDEYKNSLDMKWIEMLKSIYNRQGKIQGNWANAGTKTEHIPINQMALLCGQDLPTLDVALLERCVCLTAYNNKYTDDQKTKFNELKDLEEKGLAHLTDEFLKYRDLVIEQFAVTNSAIQTTLSGRCNNVSVRLQKNLSTLLTVFDILKDKFEFAFTFEQVLEFGIQTIKDQQKFIESSDDLKNFWSIFATLIEQDRIKEGRNYVLHDVCQIRYAGMEKVIQYSKGMMVLFIRWDGLYPMYAEYSRRSNMVALGEKTIQFYLEKTKYYQGKIKNKKFKDKVTGQTWVNQAYCFDYS